eukprot:gene9714-biopygen21260
MSSRSPKQTAFPKRLCSLVGAARIVSSCAGRDPACASNARRSCSPDLVCGRDPAYWCPGLAVHGWEGARVCTHSEPSGLTDRIVGLVGNPNEPPGMHFRQLANVPKSHRSSSLQDDGSFCKLLQQGFGHVCELPEVHSGGLPTRAWSAPGRQPVCTWTLGDHFPNCPAETPPPWGGSAGQLPRGNSSPWRWATRTN